MASSVYELFTCVFVSARYTDTSKKTLYHDPDRSEQRRHFHVLRHTGSKGEPSVTGMQQYHRIPAWQQGAQRQPTFCHPWQDKNGLRNKATFKGLGSI